MKFLIIPLFTSVIREEPRAILRNAHTHSFLNFEFTNWKDSVHYLTYCSKYELLPDEEQVFNKWYEVYYDGNEKFKGNHSEFMNEFEEEIIVSLNKRDRVIDKDSNLKTETLWLAYGDDQVYL
jgi:hypothetical protein